MNMTKASLAVCILGAALGVCAVPGWAQIAGCPPTDPSLDSDQDGFLDVTECTGIAVNGTVFHTNPTRKDVFVILTPAQDGTSLLPQGFNPYLPVTYNGISFQGLQPLGVNAIVLGPGQIADDRIVSPAASSQKAISIAESTDVNGSILGNCQWGTPNSLDGCVVFTQRIMNFINSVCDGAGDRTSDRQQIFLAYVTQSFLHETGHTLGGMTSTYNSRTGGYHYKSGAGVVMEQSITYATKGGKCTWYISPGWNTTLDPSSVDLVP
jgi:hypothetical protein